ncbi:MAG: DUF1343 domain-containing protein [Chitinophagaceae bacterium]|nr:DUF1343 domain-containing protein [Chitinophagaceae bacterium]
MKWILFFTTLLINFREPFSQQSASGSAIRPGAERMELYLPLLKGKRVGIFANHTSRVGATHLVDTLRKAGVNITVIFGPEHGFRGTAGAGEKIGNFTDEKTGIPVISLYGTKRRPEADDLKNTDILLFDIQDVGVRFYTYISSLEEFMEAAFAYQKPLLILDRPNPNGFYVDGPVLEKKYRSFVGMQPVPVVYGMTIGEYALMLAGEKWLSPRANAYLKQFSRQNKKYSRSTFAIKVIPCENYTHNSKYILPVKPSPNLPEIQSVYLYPSTCFFEGTVLSEGRGTEKPFQLFGHPELPSHLYAFTPMPNEGARHPKHSGKICYGWNLSGTPEEVLQKVNRRIQLRWLMEAYRLFPKKDSFFILPKSGKMEESFFNKLAGNNLLWKQIVEGKTEEEIRKTWEPALSAFKKIRKKYLLYPDADSL